MKPEERPVDVLPTGEVMSYENGEPSGYVLVDYVEGIRVVAAFKDFIVEVISEAAKDGTRLKLVKSFCTFEEVLSIRKSNAPTEEIPGLSYEFPYKDNDDFLYNADQKLFSPVTAPPGVTHHQSKLIPTCDFQTKDKNGVLMMGPKDPYPWMVKNMHRLGWIRWVLSERWHWERRPGSDMFTRVPKTHTTWNGLVSIV